MKKKIILLISLFILITVIFILIFFKDNMLEAYYVHKSEIVNKYGIGKIEANIEEPNYIKNQILRPNEEIVKDPIVSNSGDIDEYIRIQVYIPIAKQKYVDENENVINPKEEIDLFLFEYSLDKNWKKVEDKDFSGIIQDKKQNKYRVYTYKYMNDKNEKVVKSGEKIENPVFNKIKVINYLDIEKEINLNVIVKAIAVQAQEGKTAEQMWTYYKNQNNSAISELD